MVSGAFAWDALGWYNVRSFGHNALEATSIKQSDITLVGVDDLSSLQQGDEVHGYVDEANGNTTLFYVTDVSDDRIALQDTMTSFGYIRDHDSITLQSE